MTTRADYRDKRSRTSVTLLFHSSKPGHPFQVGYIETPRGVVVFFVEKALRRADEYTILETTHGGRRYTRRWNKSFRDRYLKTLANRFIDDVMNDRIAAQ